VSIKAHERRCTREKGIGLTHSTVTDAKRFQVHAIDISFDEWGRQIAIQLLLNARGKLA
jgi:hypothetical protein